MDCSSMSDFEQRLAISSEDELVNSEYLRQLIRSKELLNALLDSGVDNWSGYSNALRMYNGEE